MKKSLWNVEEVKRITASLDKAETEGEISPEVQEIQETYGKLDLGCAKDGVRLILNSLIKLAGGKGKITEGAGGTYISGLAVVPLDNPNSHNYPIGKVAIITNGDIAMKSNGNTGNHLPGGGLDGISVRLATPEETDAFFAE